jgi:hypothetical protein
MLKFLSCFFYFGVLGGIYFQFFFPREIEDVVNVSENQQELLLNDPNLYKGGLPLELHDLSIHLFELPSSFTLSSPSNRQTPPNSVFSYLSIQHLVYLFGGFLLGLFAMLILRYRFISDVRELAKSKEVLEYDLWKTKNDAIKRERILKRQVIDLELKIAEIQSRKEIVTLEQNTGLSAK